MNLLKEDKKFVGREGDAIPIVVEKTSGSFLIDDHGKKYIDFISGWCVGNIGWGNKEIRKKLSEYDGPEFVQPAVLYKPWVELAKLLADITPGDLQVSFRATGGTEAVEIAIQAAMSYTKRYEFISIENAYHGHSIGAMSIGASYFASHYPNLSPKTHHLSAPLNDASLDKLEKMLKTKKIAALIMEPIICNLGVEIPTENFMKCANQLCKKYGALFIMDEVMTGFMRTGKLFASEYYQITPDIMCMAKGITGGYGVLSATIMSEAIAKSMKYDFGFYSTFGWHPISVHAALVNIHYLLSHKSELEKNIFTLHEYFIKRLNEIKWSCDYKINAKGLAIAVHLDDSDIIKKKIANICEKGLLLMSMSENIFVIFPALTIDQKTAEMGLDILQKAVEGK